MSPWTRPVLGLLATLAALSLAYGGVMAFRDGADLERRAVEAARFRARLDPYAVPDATYPPSALPFFAATVPPDRSPLLPASWLILNLGAVGAIGATVALPRRDRWPRWALWAFALVVAACKPTRAGIALGQFHLIPLAAILGCEALAATRPIRAGLLLALALVKPTMSLPYLFVLAAKRRWMTLSVALSAQAMLAAFACAWLSAGPSRLLREWLDNARSQLALGTIDVPSLIGRADPSLIRWGPLATVMILLGSGLLIGIWRRRSSMGLTALATFSAAVMTYHRHYDLVLLLPTLAYFADRAIVGRSRLAGWSAVVLGAALVVPSYGRFVGRFFESVYDVAFVVVAYAALAVLLREIASER